MSRNRQRAKIPQQKNKAQKPSPPQPKALHQQQETTNPFGLSFVVPTELVKLPSFGRLYSENSPVYGMEEVQVKSMTAAEEDILINTSFIEQGIVFDKLIDSIMLTPGIQSIDLMDCDKIAILMSARRTGYGDKVDFATICSECGNEFDIQVSLSQMMEDSLNREIEEKEEEWEYLIESNTYSFKLPVTELTVQIKLLTPEDTQHLEASKTQKERLGLPYNETLEFLRTCIVAAENIVDRTPINKLVEILPAADARKIRVVHNQNVPTVKARKDTTCPSCKHSETKEVPFSLGWFWS